MSLSGLSSGTKWAIYADFGAGDVFLGLQTTHSVNIARELVDVSNKMAANVRTIIPNEGRVTADVTSDLYFDDNTAVQSAVAALESGDKFKLTAKNTDTGDVSYTSDVFISAVNDTGADNTGYVRSVTFSSDGQLKVSSLLLVSTGSEILVYSYPNMSVKQTISLSRQGVAYDASTGNMLTTVDETVYVHDGISASVLKSFVVPDTFGSSTIATDDNGSAFVAPNLPLGDDESVYQMNVDAETLTTNFDFLFAQSTGIGYLNGDLWSAQYDGGGNVIQMDGISSSQLQTVATEGSQNKAITFAADGSLIAHTESDGLVKLYVGTSTPTTTLLSGVTVLDMEFIK